MAGNGASTFSVTYVPAKAGYLATLRTSADDELSVSRTDVDAELTVASDAGLEDNPALVGSLASFGDSELAFRRARSDDKRKSFKRAADDAKDKTLFIARLREALTDKSDEGWCSACLQRTSHQESTWHTRPKVTCLCKGCGSATTRCAVPGCPHFATVWSRGATQSLRYCAEHRHEIPSFEKLTQSIGGIDKYPKWLEFDAVNASRVTKSVAVVASGAVVLAPVALVAAPAIGAALGASALGGGLSGAAAVSHGLAMLGGGSLAVGGLGMAGGTMVVTAAGVALGGTLGGAVASAYTSQDKSFDIEKFRDGEGPAVLISWGWLSKGKPGMGNFQSLIDDRFPNSPVYRVHWGAKELKDLAFFFGAGGAVQGGKAAVAALAKKGMHAAGRALGPLGAALAAADVAANPWTVATNRATMTGAVIADAIARTEHESFVLIGHSLGGRVMVSAAQALGTREGSRRIESMHLLGAALSTKQNWLTLSKAVSGTIWNYHSTNDPVLKLAYKVGQVGRTSVGQAGFNSRFANIKDRDVSKSVKQHWDYFTKMNLAI